MRNIRNKIFLVYIYNIFIKSKFQFKLILLIWLSVNYFLVILFSSKFKIQLFYLKRVKYLKKYHIYYNESNLITLQDKLNWLIIHDSNELKSKCADKILLHEYSKEKLGKDICNKILKIYNNTKEIKLNELPEKFVLKANHGSGFNIIVNNKSSFDYINAVKSLNNWLKIDYGKIFMEFHYSLINRKIFAEEFIGDDLKNYKFMCYHGKPKYVYLSITENNIKYRNFYDMKWNFLNFYCLSRPHPSKNFSKPKFFGLMKRYASILSKDFIFVRVDLYELENEIRLGELTFTPMGSFFNCINKSHEIDLGKEIKIKNKK